MSNRQLKFKAAAVQAAPVLKDRPEYFDTGATVEKAVKLIREAGSNGARLVVFPECWIPCFPYWSLDFTDRQPFIDIFARYLESSVEVPGVETAAIGEAARKANAYVAIGINERDPHYQVRMYNSILYIDPDGEVMGVHRKICNTVQERFFHTPGEGGDNLKTVFKTDIGYLGGSICGEHHQFPMLYYWLLQGMQVHCSLWPGRTGLERLTDLATRAVCAGLGVFGVLASTYFPDEAMPKDFYRNSQFSMPNAFAGGSGIVSPYGDYIAGPVYGQETIVYGDLDFTDIARSRYGTALAGIYSRWDLISLNVRQNTYEPVTPMGDGLAPGPDGLVKLEERLKHLEAQLAALISREAVKAKVRDEAL
ncbi:MAG: carbon-nitrogen hydrolase family protein [Chloroflexi bacterium]|nr:carbon-nitrogen hydrolase family protein [Chloroflexota bacterium]